jgi:hypothetical protein
MQTKSIVFHVQNFLADLRATASAARALDRHLLWQTHLVRGQNLQMMDFAELGRPSLRAHLAHPLVARLLPSSRAVARVLRLSRWIGTATTWALTISIGILLAAAASQLTLG